MRLLIILLFLIISKSIIPQNEIINIDSKIDSIQNEIILNEKKNKQLYKELEGLREIKKDRKNNEVTQNQSLKIKIELPASLYPKPEFTKSILIIPEHSEIEVIGFEYGYWKVIYKTNIGYISEYYLENNEKVNELFRDEIKSKPKSFLSNAEEVKFLEEINKAKKKGIPILFREAKITFNAIDNPEAYIKLQNISDKIIDAYTLDIHCFDRFENKVLERGYGNNVFEGISQNTIKPDRTDSGYWTLYGHETTSIIKVYIDKVHFTDGTTWRPSKGKNPMIEGKSNK